MNLYLMQHGEAVSKQENPERPLSEKGRLQIQYAAAGIRHLGLHFDAIIASPKQRSRQTAEIIADVVGIPAENILERDSFLPKGNPAKALRDLREIKGKTSIFVAGHKPSLPLVAALLMGIKNEESIHFENGGLCCLTMDEAATGKAALRYCLTHDQLRKIAP